MNTQLYTVTLDDLGTYTVTVAADSPEAAESIAKGVLFEEDVTPGNGLRIAKREAEAHAVLAADQPIRKFQVKGTYTLDFFLTVPASTREEAERHARRLYEATPFPWEHDSGEDHVQWHTAREVVT